MKGRIQGVLILGAALIGPVANSAIVDPRLERDDAGHVTISWKDAAEVEIYSSGNANSARGATLVDAHNRDGRERLPVTLDKPTYFLLRDRSDGGLAEVGERVLPLEQASNFRDLGGYQAADGRHVRWGLIFRSGATPLLTPLDIHYIEALGLKSMVDLRSTEERRLAPSRLMGSGIRYIASDYAFATLPDGYFETLAILKPQFHAAFSELLAHQGPISINCTGGQDRTGILSAFILLSLGVPRAIVLDDYHLSTKARKPQYEVPALDLRRHRGNSVARLLADVRKSQPEPLYSPNGRSLLAELLDQIDARFGSLDGYLTENLGVGAAERASLKSYYLQ